MDPLARTLEHLWRDKLPLATAMGLRVTDWRAQRLTVAAELAPNVNPHGTAFAGSLYSIAALTGWGVVWLGLRTHGLAGDIVLRSASIAYRRPVTEDIVCVCSGSPVIDDVWLGLVAAEGRAGCTLECSIESGGRDAVAFSGTYHVRRED